MKRFIRITFLITFFLAIVVSVLLIIKPGASIFHIKRRLPPENFKPHKGHAYHLPLTLNPLIFPSEGLLLFEDNVLLNRTNTAHVIQKGLGSYSITDQEDDRSNLIFSSNDNTKGLNVWYKSTNFRLTIRKIEWSGSSSSSTILQVNPVRL